MKKYFIYIPIIIMFLLIIGFLFFRNSTNTSNNGNSSASRLSTNVSLSTNSNKENRIVNEIHVAEHDVREQELATFSTKLGGKNTPRSRNIGITTSRLNGTTVNNGETFSFCGTIGDPTAEMGYEKADSFDANGKTVKTYGGGNCQVSSTLYNVVLQINELEVIERHPHAKPVDYVEKGKDATVAYGSVDFKFKNNTGNTIKIYASSDLNGVNIKIVKIYS